MSPRNFLGPPWTPEHIEILRARYKRGAVKAIAKLVGRSEYSVRAKAFTLGLKAQRFWTPAEDEELRDAWGEENIKGIARRLKRPVGGVYERAQDLGLGLGCPPGYAYLSHEAERTGFTTETLRMIFRWADVPLQRSMSRPGSHRVRPHHIVDPTLVDEAIQNWLATESLHAAARARGLGDDALKTILRHFGGPGVPKRPGGRAHWRIPTTVIDEAIKKSRKFHARTLTTNEIAEETGEPLWSVRTRLAQAGLRRGPRKAWRVTRDDLERVRFPKVAA